MFYYRITVTKIYRKFFYSFLLLTTFSTLFYQPIYSEVSMDARIAKLQAERISNAIEEHQEAIERMDYSVACTKLRSAIHLVKLNKKGLEQLEPGSNFDEFISSWTPRLEWCTMKKYWELTE